MFIEKHITNFVFIIFWLLHNNNINEEDCGFKNKLFLVVKTSNFLST